LASATILRGVQKCSQFYSANQSLANPSCLFQLFFYFSAITDIILQLLLCSLLAVMTIQAAVMTEAGGITT
jgi:hypothetical protein